VTKRQRIVITGRVQGVGFRPAVYRLAKRLGLTGFVYNDSRGVTIELQGREGEIADFVKRLNSSDAAPLAEIKSCEVCDIEPVDGERGFKIDSSRSQGAAVCQVTADIATCGDCLKEMADEKDFRYRYPFINCTNCGPRYSIVKAIPYDRPNTTMSVFEMCERCAAQYEDAADRRFHAQPVACSKCGPAVELTDSNGNALQKDSDRAIAETAGMLKDGKIVAIKGIGGFHLAVDALNDEAVKELRRRKRRDHKPFAMMAASVESIKKYAVVGERQERVLTSPQAPIILLDKRRDSPIAASVAAGVGTYAFMLCYAPLHYLLFEQGPEVLVMTSGNISDEPLICENELALERLSHIADAFLMHNREIYRQLDDSIVHFIDDKPVLLRRARGYVPTPVVIDRLTNCDILAAGSDLKNTFCFVKQNQLICSEHIGDLEDAEVYRHYLKSVEHLGRLFEAEPEVVVCDLHPGYLSSQYARSIPDVQIITVQHHWAHIASVMAEHEMQGPVIGLACDGTGYGTDGAIWGCECLIATLSDFKRFGHLAYYPLAGADAASKEPIRPLLGLLSQSYGRDFDLDKFGWLLDALEPDRTKQRIITEQITKQVNTVATSSIGRVFDAVAAMLGLGSYNHFEAQLPMALEAIASPGEDGCYAFDLAAESDRPLQIDFHKTIRAIVCDVQHGTGSDIISARFHNTLAVALLDTARAAARTTDCKTVVLSGGVFCNRYLANRLVRLLWKNDFSVLYNRDFPANDGGISVGQAAIADRIAMRHS